MFSVSDGSATLYIDRMVRTGEHDAPNAVFDRGVEDVFSSADVGLDCRLPLGVRSGRASEVNYDIEPVELFEYLRPVRDVQGLAVDVAVFGVGERRRLVLGIVEPIEYLATVVSGCSRHRNFGHGPYSGTQ